MCNLQLVLAPLSEKKNDTKVDLFLSRNSVKCFPIKVFSTLAKFGEPIQGVREVIIYGKLYITKLNCCLAALIRDSDRVRPKMGNCAAL